jgi:starch synthase
MSKPLSIVFAASEIFPYSKTGGLADVMGALPKALSALGHDVKVIAPFYRQTRKGNFDISRFSKKIFVQLGDRIVDAEIAVTKLTDQIDTYLIVKDEYYDREDLYKSLQGDYKDNAERFIFFSKAVLSTLEELEIKPDILHCHDWQTGLVSTLLKTIEINHPFFHKTKTIFTIHNMAYQGLFWHYDMHMTNLPWDTFTPEGIEFYGKINLLKAGLVYSDVLTTVSRKYAEEIKTHEYGAGLDGVLVKRSKDLCGILNGVDYQEWDSSSDRFLTHRYSAQSLGGKELCKKELLQEFHLNASLSTPVISMISRLVDQKGFDLVVEVIDLLLSEDCTFILLGSGEEKYQNFFKNLAQKYPGKVGVKIGFDEAMSHRIEAGSDFFLMPSRFEPCGLNQIYSLKYGTIPIVRATGGLDDTIENFNPVSLKGNGFKFADYSGASMLEKVREAFKIYHDRRLLQALVQNAMKCDFSWEKSAKQYEDVYFNALKK